MNIFKIIAVVILLAVNSLAIAGSGSRRLSPHSPEVRSRETFLATNDQQLYFTRKQTDIARYVPDDLVWLNRKPIDELACTPEGNVFRKDSPEYVCHVYKSDSSNTAWAIRFRVIGNQYDRIWKVEESGGKLVLTPWKGPGAFVSPGALQFAAARPLPDQPVVAENQPKQSGPEDCRHQPTPMDVFACVNRTMHGFNGGSNPVGAAVKGK